MLPAGQAMTVMRVVGVPLRSCPMMVPVFFVRYRFNVPCTGSGVSSFASLICWIMSGMGTENLPVPGWRSMR